MNRKKGTRDENSSHSKVFFVVVMDLMFFLFFHFKSNAFMCGKINKSTPDIRCLIKIRGSKYFQFLTL